MLVSRSATLTAANLPEGFSSRSGRNMRRSSGPHPVHALRGACQVRSRVLRGIGPAARAQPLDGAYRMDSAARAVRLAVQSCRGASEFQYMLQIPAPQQPVGKPGVEEVAGAGRIDNGN